MADSAANLPAAARLAAWRGVLASTLARGTVVLSVPTFLWLLSEGMQLHQPRLFWFVGVTFVSALGCALAPISVRARSWWLVLQLGLTATAGVPLLGIVGGIGGLVMFLTLLGVLLLGAREAALALGLTLLALLTWLAAVLLGAMRPPLELSDAGLPSNAARMIGTVAALGVLTLLASSYLIQKLTTTLFEAESLLASERAETKRRQVVEQELIRAQKVEALGRLAGGVAHDVNNNLTVALASADLIERKAAGDTKTCQLCAAIHDACNNASTLTRQLLTLGRREVLKPALVSLSEVIQHIQGLLQASLGRDVRLNVSVADGVPPVYVNPRQLEQVLLNLAINARDAMPNGGELTIAADQTDGTSADYRFATDREGPRHAVRLHVRDCGTGIEDSILSQIVEPFFTTKGPERGTGLGLAVARAFADASGGRLGIDTTLGRGSTFTLELSPASPAQIAEAQLAAAGPAVTRGATILVAEADARVRQSIALELRTAGHSVLEAEDGRAALEYARQARHIDLLCTDAVLPRLSGEELIRRLGQLHPDARILLCSAYVEQEHLRELLKTGRYAALVKPFSPTELREAVAHILMSPPTLAPNVH